MQLYFICSNMHTHFFTGNLLVKKKKSKIYPVIIRRALFQQGALTTAFIAVLSPLFLCYDNQSNVEKCSP